ncbi:MAG: Hsp20/alpha crystallin family protein [Nitrospirota bacterium]|jgi:HSP20 family protein
MAVRDLIPWRDRRREVPVRRDEADPFHSLHREMDRLFDDFLHGFELAPWMGDRWPTMSRGYAPQVDVAETDTEVIVTAELPGMEEKDIDVALAHGNLALKGEKREEKESKERGYYRSERSYGSFARTIPLPCEVEEDKVSATFKKGVLTISLPKTPEARREVKHIDVKTD